MFFKFNDFPITIFRLLCGPRGKDHNFLPNHILKRTVHKIKLSITSLILNNPPRLAEPCVCTEGVTPRTSIGIDHQGLQWHKANGAEKLLSHKLHVRISKMAFPKVSVHFEWITNTTSKNVRWRGNPSNYKWSN